MSETTSQTTTHTSQEGSHTSAFGLAVREGYMDFLGYKTYYRVAGDLRESIAAHKYPLIVLHGGPGSTHNSLEVLDELGKDGRAIVYYDQLGCGNSYLEGHPELWVAQTWVDELSALIAHLEIPEYYLLGQSWGGMLLLEYALQLKPQGLKGAILSSTLPASQLWAKENHRQARMLPLNEWSALCAAEKSGDFSSKEYTQALDHFMELHCCDTFFDEDMPECLRRKKRFGDEAYETAWGPNELNATGTLASWDVIDRLQEITCPALIISGTDDECTPLIAKTMYDRIPNSTWELFEGCRHMCYVDGNKHYIKTVGAFMNEHDA